MKQKLLIIAIVFTLAGCLSACATSGKNFWAGDSVEGSFRLDLLVHGSQLPVFEHHSRSFVAGWIGERYVVRVHNNSNRRVEAVIAVDGRDVIDGQPADIDKRGYIIDPYGYVDVDGWRTSMSHVATFRFTTKSDSYTSRMGTPGKVGLISVAIFPEKMLYQPPPHPPYIVHPHGGGPGDWEAKEERSMQAFGSTADSKKKNLGTQYGESRYSSVAETQFERDSSSPITRLSIRYDDAQGLCAAGIKDLCHPPRHPYYPDQPIEPARTSPEFAQPPPGWDHFHPWY